MQGVSLKINKCDNITKLIPIIREANNKSIAQIKNDIENKENILASKRYILEELELILNTSLKLVSASKDGVWNQKALYVKLTSSI